MTGKESLKEITNCLGSELSRVLRRNLRTSLNTAMLIPAWTQTRFQEEKPEKESATVHKGNFQAHHYSQTGVPNS
jgi:short-subunit dehydrogenase